MITNKDGLTLYAVMYNAGMMGTDAIEGVWAKDEDDACSQLTDAAWAWFWDFNFEEDLEEDIEPELDIFAEPWNDEVHPQKWPRGCKYSHEFT